MHDELVHVRHRPRGHVALACQRHLALWHRAATLLGSLRTTLPPALARSRCSSQLHYGATTRLQHPIATQVHPLAAGSALPPRSHERGFTKLSTRHVPAERTIKHAEAE
jgi:hypothetical protein